MGNSSSQKEEQDIPYVKQILTGSYSDNKFNFLQIVEKIYLELKKFQNLNKFSETAKNLLLVGLNDDNFSVPLQQNNDSPQTKFDNKKDAALKKLSLLANPPQKQASLNRYDSTASIENGIAFKVEDDDDQGEYDENAGPVNTHEIVDIDNSKDPSAAFLYSLIFAEKTMKDSNTVKQWEKNTTLDINKIYIAMQEITRNNKTGGAPSEYVQYNSRKYKVRTQGRKKYIIVKNEKVWLSLIRNKYTRLQSSTTV